MTAGGIQSVITGVAALAGAVAGGGIKWLSDRASARRSRAEARQERRHGAYAAFIAAAEELRRLLLRHETMESPPAPDSRFGDLVARHVGSVDRAFVGVALAGPREARAAADDVRQRAWRLLGWLGNEEPVLVIPGEPERDLMDVLGELYEEYISAADRFTETASALLDS